MNYNIKHPCAQNCERRNAICHATCPDWLDYEAKHKAEVEEVRLKRELNALKRRKFGNG